MLRSGLPHGCAVLIPTLIDREYTWSGNASSGASPISRIASGSIVRRLSWAGPHRIRSAEGARGHRCVAVGADASAVPLEERGAHRLWRGGLGSVARGGARAAHRGDGGRRVFWAARPALSRTDLPESLWVPARVRQCGAGGPGRTAQAPDRVQRVSRRGRPASARARPQQQRGSRRDRAAPVRRPRCRSGARAQVLPEASAPTLLTLLSGKNEKFFRHTRRRQTSRSWRRSICPQNRARQTGPTDIA